MSIRKNYALFSSFWFWFVTGLMLNHIILVVIFLLVMLKPIGDSLGQVVGFAGEVTQRIDSADPDNGLSRLAAITSKYPAIRIEKTHSDRFSEIPIYFPGLQIMKRSLEARAGGELRLGYRSAPDQALLIETQGPSPITLGISYSGRFFGAQFFILSFAIVFIISACAAFWISSRLTKPLNRLSEAAIRLGTDKDFRQIPITQNSSREIKELTDTLNKMRAALDKSTNERENLLASIAHDLRTPLSRMRFSLELDGRKNPELTDALREDVIEMSAIMEQFIELSRLNMEAEEAWITADITPLLHGIRDKYERVGIMIDMGIANGLPSIKHKPIALTRLLYNLIDNAYRHGNGTVVIRGLKYENSVQLVVSNPTHEEDEGSGLMRALSAAESGRTAGLGLSIVRRFAEVHGATLQEVVHDESRDYILTFCPFETPSLST